MEKLIKAYLMYSENYYADSQIRHISQNMGGNGLIYTIEITNECSWNGIDEINISLSELLVFLFERQA